MHHTNLIEQRRRDARRERLTEPKAASLKPSRRDRRAVLLKAEIAESFSFR